MAQNALTVLAPNPTPPTNMSFTGATPPNPPNYTKNTYNEVDNWGIGTNSFPPPYFDDGSAGTLTAFAANTSALASGSGATAGGTENTYPGADVSAPYELNFMGAVPASTSVAHEGAGTEVVFTAPGSVAAAPTQSVGVGPVATAATIAAGPNATHASSLSPATNPTLSSLGTPSSASGASGTYSQTVTGVGFTRQSVIYVNGVAQTTTYNSSTSLTAPTVTKKTTAGTWPVTVVTGGSVVTAPQTWTFT